MGDQTDRARAFAALHVAGDPLLLWNIWDAGSARAVATVGAAALATGSWSVAAAQGFDDGQDLPMETALVTARQIVAAVDLPVSVDFEGCYATSAAEAGANARRLLETGAVGLNMEDRVVGGKGLHTPQEQAARIAAVRAMADDSAVPFFINARTDVFFSGREDDAEVLLEEVVARAGTYADAGASGLFVPGLGDPALIARLCQAVALPVNVMRMGKAAPIADLARAGVSRISHGPGPYMVAMKALEEAARAAK